MYGRVVLPNKLTGWPKNYTGCGNVDILCCTENNCTQATVQWYLLIFAFLSVPILLCVKPCVLHSRNKKKNSRT